MVNHPRFVEGDEPVAMTHRLYAPLTGDHLQHEIRLIPDHTSCADLQTLADRGWLVLTRFDGTRKADDFPLDRGCFAGVRPAYQNNDFAVFYRPLVT
jgi:hypothetical protein